MAGSAERLRHKQHRPKRVSPERRVSPDLNPRFLRPASDSWIAHTISEAFDTVGWGKPEVVDVIGEDFPAWLIESKSPSMLAIDGRLSTLMGKYSDFGKFKNILATAKSHRAYFEYKAASNEEGPNYPKLLENLERDIEFTVAVHKIVAEGEDLEDALVKIGTEDKINYEKDGFAKLSKHEIKLNVGRSLVFAASAFIVQSHEDEQLSEIGKARAVKQIRESAEAAKIRIFEEQESDLPPGQRAAA